MPYNSDLASFHTGITAETLRAKIDRKSAISLQKGHFDPKFQVQGVAPRQSFLHGYLGQRNFVADFLQAKCDFTRKSVILRFWDPL